MDLHLYTTFQVCLTSQALLTMFVIHSITDESIVSILEGRKPTIHTDGPAIWSSVGHRVSPMLTVQVRNQAASHPISRQAPILYMYIYTLMACTWMID